MVRIYFSFRVEGFFIFRGDVDWMGQDVDIEKLIRVDVDLGGWDSDVFQICS